MKKMRRVVVAEEDMQAFQQEMTNQTESRSIPKSTDPKNFPVYDFPTNAKDLIYVPNHVVLNADGVPELRMDKPLIHAVTQGKRFTRYRCVHGLTFGGYSGECPLCDATDDCFTLANFKIDEQCAAQGLNPKDTEDKAVKAIRSANFSSMVIKQPTRYFVFPIVVIETKDHDGKTPEKDANGAYKMRPCWYVISEKQYEKKWEKAFDSMEDEPTHPGGNCFILNFTGSDDRMQSAGNLSVAHKKISGFDKIAPKLDKLTEEWTPIKASETVIMAIPYMEEDLQELADETMEGTRNLIAVYNSSKNMAEAGIAQNAEQPFNLEKKESAPTPVEGLTTDMDDDIPVE